MPQSRLKGSLKTSEASFCEAKTSEASFYETKTQKAACTPTFNPKGNPTMKKLLFPLLLAAAMLPAQAADYFLPDAECDGSANVRAAPDTHSKILTELNYLSTQHKILGRQGKWLRIQLNGGRTGYVHQSQGYIVQNYIVASPDGSANVRHNVIDQGQPITGQSEIFTTLPNGTRVQIIPKLNRGDWLYYTNQGAYTEDNKLIYGYIHKSQLRRAD